MGLHSVSSTTSLSYFVSWYFHRLNFITIDAYILSVYFANKKQLFRATNHPDFLEIGFLVSHKNGYILVSSFSS